jgi:hypothetical protein
MSLTELTRRVAALEREGISTRTVDRHVARGFPAPEMIHNRAYWWSDVLDAHDASLLQKAKRITARRA